MKETIANVIKLLLSAACGAGVTAGYVTEAELAQVGGYIAGIIVLGITIWQRRAAAKKVAEAVVKTVPLLLIGTLCISTLPGCNLSPAEKEAVASTLLNVAKAGLNVGLQALAKKVPELAAVVPVLQAKFQVTFGEASAATTPTELAAAIREDVLTSIADPAGQEAIIAILIEALGAEIDQQATVTAAGPDSADGLVYALSVKAALAKGQP